MHALTIERVPAVRKAILQLEETLKSLVHEQPAMARDLPLSHVFAPGAYARTILIPADTLVVGKIHKHAHLNMLMQGTVSVATEEGPMRLMGPVVMCSKAGTKRVVYAHTDTIWTTVHLTESTDLDAIEEQIIAKTYDQFEALQDVDVVQLLPLLRREEEL